MATVTRGTKAAGGTSFVDDTDILASEVNTDLDTLYTLVNGNIDSDNISTSANIPNSALAEIDGTKVADHADDDATYETITTPGDTASLSRPTDLEEEHERIRYRIDKNKGYAGTVKYYDNVAGQLENAAWVEPPIRGRNLLINSGLEGSLSAADDVPYGWTKFTGTHSNTNEDAPDTEGTHARQLNLTATGSAVMSQTVQGLKISTKYLFGFTYLRNSGTVQIAASGGLGSSADYSNPTYTDNSSSTMQHVNLIVQSDTSGSDITISIGGVSSPDIDIVEAWFYELGDGKPADVPTGLLQTASTSTEVTNIPATVASATDWDTQWTDVSTLALAQFVPGPGYRLVYEASIAWASVLNSQQYFFGFRLELDTGSTSVVDGPYIEMDDDVSLGETNGAGVVRLTYMIDNPTPGTTYTLTPQVTAADSAGGAGSAPRLHPLVAVTAQGGASAGSNSAIQTTSRAWLRLERI